MVDVATLVEYAGNAGISRGDKESYTEYLSTALGSIVDTERLEALGKAGLMHRCTMRAGEYLYTPMGFIVMERTLGGVYSYGYRTASFEKTEKTVGIFREMKQQLEVVAGADDPLVKLWQTVLEVV